MKRFVYASLAAASYSQIIYQRQERLGLNPVKGAVNYARGWYKENDDGMAAKAECRRKYLVQNENLMFYSNDDRSDDKAIVNCLAGFVAQDLQRVVEYGVKGQHCYEQPNLGIKQALGDDATYFDEYYNPELIPCLMDAAKYLDTCPPELESVPMIANFIELVKTDSQYNKFYWCYYGKMKSYLREQTKEFEFEDSAYGESKIAIGECEKEAGWNVNVGPNTFNMQQQKILSLLFKRNCRLSFMSEDNNPCRPNQEWMDNGKCRDYECTCPGNGLAPDSDLHSDEDLATCNADGLQVCAECDDGYVGQGCEDVERDCEDWEHEDEYGACQANYCPCLGGTGADIDTSVASPELRAKCTTNGEYMCGECYEGYSGDQCNVVGAKECNYLMNPEETVAAQQNNVVAKFNLFSSWRLSFSMTSLSASGAFRNIFRIRNAEGTDFSSVRYVSLNILGGSELLELVTTQCSDDGDIGDFEDGWHSENTSNNPQSFVVLEYLDYMVSIEYNRVQEKMRLYVNGSLKMEKSWASTAVCGETDREVQLMVSNADDNAADVEITGFKYEENNGDDFLGPNYHFEDHELDNLHNCELSYEDYE